MTSHTETMAGSWEYVTYAPRGHRCSACLKPIETFDLVRRGALRSSSGDTVAIYRHVGKCPEEQT